MINDQENVIVDKIFNFAIEAINHFKNYQQEQNKIIHF